MKNYLTELFGTFFLVLIIGINANPLAIGFGLMVLIYLGFHSSGAHYNPIVTLAMLFRKEISLLDSINYIIFQILGAVLAGSAVFFLTSVTMEVQPNLSATVYQILGYEVLFTYLYVYAFLTVTSHPKLKNNTFYGLVLGATIMVGLFSSIQTSGGVFNPATSVGVTLSHLFIGDGVSKYYLWYYLVGPALGGLIATAHYSLINVK
jgi:aquaporin Z|tara:strand:- start:5 stop:622 length:618 start_codon:yes stop_codon:yes gene_type:complete